MSFADFAKRYKLNYFAYGPKSDPYHLSKWNEEYPTNATITEEERELGVMTQEEFKVLIDKFNDSHIDFVWSIHPAMGDNKICLLYTSISLNNSMPVNASFSSCLLSKTTNAASMGIPFSFSTSFR